MSKTDDTSQDEVKDEEQKVTIGGVEMTEAEATELLESGKTMKQLQADYPEVDFKEMPKAFTQTRQELAKLKEPKAKPEELDADEEARRKQIREFFKDPLVKEELKNLTTQEQTQLKEDLAMEETLKNLESEFDGKDGRPVFDRAEILKYGMENNVFNPRAAYKEMYEDELDDWKLKKAGEKRRPTTSFERAGSGGGATPPVAKPATDFRGASANALARAESDD